MRLMIKPYKMYAKYVRQHVALSVAMASLALVVVAGTTYAAFNGEKPLQDPGTITAPQTQEGVTTGTPTKKIPSLKPISTPSSSSNGQTVAPGEQPTCAALLTERNSSVTALDSELQKQLGIMQSIVNNTADRNQLLGYGSNMMLSQAQIDAAFNSAKLKAADLQSQITTTKQKYQNRLWAGNCIAEIKTLL